MNVITNRAVAELFAMLTPRGDDGIIEDDWLEQWIMPLPGAKADGGGNVWVEVGTDSGVMFSCHVDTAHGKKPVIPTIVLEEGYIRARSNNQRRLILGADDTVGCWIMRQMILGNVPGTYIFHRSEESGGIGARWIIANTAPTWQTTPFHIAVAFDRKGTKSVITHQGMSRCCSDTFANGLVAALKEHGLEYKLDDGGTFTDTKVYAHLVPECTNLSVGYYAQHTTSEEIDLGHLIKFTNACLALDWAGLPVARDPKVEEKKTWASDSYVGGRNFTIRNTPEQWLTKALLTKTTGELTALINQSAWDAACAIEILLDLYVEGTVVSEPTVSGGADQTLSKDGNLEKQTGLIFDSADYAYGD